MNDFTNNFRQFLKISKAFKLGEKFLRSNRKEFKMQQIFQEEEISQKIVDELLLLGNRISEAKLN